MAYSEVSIRAMHEIEQRRVVCDCGQRHHEERCALTRAWGVALRRAEAQLRRETGQSGNVLAFAGGRS